MTDLAIIDLPDHGDVNIWSERQKALADAAGLVKRKAGENPVVAPRATIEAFLALCRSTQLNPFLKQIYCIERGGKWGTEVSIDGARIVAHRSGAFEGYDEVVFSVDGGVTWSDSFVATEEQPHPTHARVGVWRTGFRVPVTAVARWESYAVMVPVWEDRKKVGEKVSDMWSRMPDVMLSKVAEMLALRRAFPNDLSAAYIAEEMEQAGTGDERPPVRQSRDWEALADACSTKADVHALFTEIRGKGEMTDELDAKLKRLLESLPESLPPDWAETVPEPSEWEQPIDGDAPTESDAPELSEEERAEVARFGLDEPEAEEVPL